MKIYVEIYNSKYSYKEEVDYLEEYFEELSTNGANPDIEAMTFEHFTRAIDDSVDDLSKYNTRDNNSHFIFGWVESLAQSDRNQVWMREEDVRIKVWRE